MLVRIPLLLSLLWTAQSFSFEEEGVTSKDFSCSVSGAAGEDACDASHATDGTSCVWCSIQGFGVCVNEMQAKAMEQAIPGIDCDDDSDDDDDDDVPADDDTPADYWECLKDYTDQDACTQGGCSWCTTKAGYGICLDTQAAEKAAESDWFQCTTSNDDMPVPALELVLSVPKDEVRDPTDLTCLSATLEGDEAACESTVDAEGNACNWCLVAGADLCLNSEQAQIAEQFGGSCDTESTQLADPSDTSCLMATLEGDENACESTLDADGTPCEWCMVSSVNLCLTSEQAEIAEQFGGSCATHQELEDPTDTSCLMATLDGDQVACENTLDTDSAPCQWCMVASVNLCLTTEQAQIAQQFGGSCNADAADADDAAVQQVADPSDTTCLAATLEGDEAACEATMDADGNRCEWCMVSSVNLCLSGEQAEIAQEFGGTCDSAKQQAVADPFDTTCLQATVEGDQSTCEATVDADGESCKWCSVSSVDLCVSADQAGIMEQFGGTCADNQALLSAAEM